MISASELSVSWRKSSYSTNGGNCLEWAPAHIPTGTVPIRDSKNPHGPALLFPVRSWRAFISAVNEDRLPH
ncbi:DUF397 domain-containing protein [Streptomyces syringium]|uniref:DUF397 domain-containing protein n=1 Tax=Streptomyces syringium TaxID=76729 RepID=UPI0037CECE4F